MGCLWPLGDLRFGGSEPLALLSCHAVGDKKTEMADALTDGIDDGLVMRRSLTLPYRSVIQPSACGGGVMLFPLEQKTTMGNFIFRRSTRAPSSMVSSAGASRLPTNSLSATGVHSCAFSRTWLFPALEAALAAGLGADLRAGVVLLGTAYSRGPGLRNSPQARTRRIPVPQVIGQGSEPYEPPRRPPRRPAQ
jgi:hypothetical protein